MGDEPVGDEHEADASPPSDALPLADVSPPSSPGDPALLGVWQELDGLVIDVLAARERVAAAQAAETQLLARAVGLVEQRTVDRRKKGLKFGNDLPLREVAAELGTAMRVADRTAQRRINDAHTLVTRFPATFTSWREGRIERAHAAIIAEEGVILGDDELRADYEGLIVPVAEVESAGRLREIARAIAARLDPDAAAVHRVNAAKERRVAVYDIGDGLARLVADLPAPLAYAILDRLTAQATSIRDIEHADTAAAAAAAAEAAAAAGADVTVETEAAASESPSDPDETARTDGAAARIDGAAARIDGAADGDAAVAVAEPLRSLDQIRADVLADMLLTGIPTAHATDERLAGLPAVRGTVRVTIPLATLAGVTDQPATLEGVGPVDADLVRAIVAGAPGWDRVFTDGRTGVPVEVDRYRPSAALTRFLKVRDERCRFPGCRRPAENCDDDHTIPASEGGPTSACNLGNFCRRHHTLKHASPWQVEQLPGGKFKWTSPTGRVYTDFPPETMRYIPDRKHRTVVFTDSATFEDPPF